jgi:hypothetical protein
MVATGKTFHQVRSDQTEAKAGIEIMALQYKLTHVDRVDDHALGGQPFTQYEALANLAIRRWSYDNVG